MKTHFIIKRFLLGLALLASCDFGAFAKVVLPVLVSDGMVLQRNAPLTIWGKADPSEKVCVKFQKKQYKVTADENGKWAVTLPAMKAGGPYSMTINNIVLNDILVGDVFLCSGQSNMELPVNRVMDKYADEIEGYENTSVRYVKVPYSYDFSQQKEDIRPVTWRPMTTENVKDFSAICYFFSRLLEEKTNVPVGIINASWGGTPVEAWVSEKGLQNFPEYVHQKALYEDTKLVSRITETERLHQQAWNKVLYKSDAGLHGVTPWYAEDYDDSDWEKVDMFSDNWAIRNGRPLNGVHWFRKDFFVPEDWSGKEAVLRLGCIVDADSVFVNGHFVGTVSYQYPPRIYKVPSKLLKKGKNQLTVRLFSYGGRPSFVKEKPYKILFGKGQPEKGESEINLEGSWKYHLGAPMPAAPGQTAFHYKPTGLYNAMIAPLLNYTVSGVIWYQGESNVSRRNEYKDLLTAMISDWRQRWNKSDMPFYIIELADFLSPTDKGGRTAWAEFRKAQAEVADTNKNVTLIKNSDLGEWNDIHPLDKKTLGQRVAAAILIEMNTKNRK